jgi:alkylated DNA repair protein (DNA oxidative demethylase)
MPRPSSSSKRPKPAHHAPQLRSSRPRTAGTPGPADRRGHVILQEYLGARERSEILAWLETLRPIWEFRYSTTRPPPRRESQRRLLRPVYWLGNWQFACLDYYRPPQGVHERAVAAEPFPPVLAGIVADIERRARRVFPREHIPERWHLNTCLVNFYGDRREGERWVDCARVGEHRDFEPGPVASLSIGERALFQFVARRKGDERPPPLLTQWLDDRSLQLFAGPFFKDRVLHRVQRVDHRAGITLPPAIEDFRSRRVNFTFRYVPDEHVVPFAELSARARADVEPYVRQLAISSPFFARALAAAARTPG